MKIFFRYLRNLKREEVFDDGLKNNEKTFTNDKPTKGPDLSGVLAW